MNYIILLLFYVIKGSDNLSINHLQDLFNGRRCIEGTLHMLHIAITNEEPKITKVNIKQSAEDLPGKLVSNTETLQAPEKTAVTKLQELAQYNQIHYYFELEQEEGPAHNKLFTIKLVLGNEQYNAQGRSLKKSKQAAAAIALENTEYQHPPLKTKLEKTLTPTVVLNNLAAKLGVAVRYQVITDPLESALNAKGTTIVDEKSKRSYLQKLNDSVHLNDSIRIRKDESNLQGPFRVKVIVDNEVFVGEGPNIQTAKHDGAAKALSSYKKRPQNEFDCLTEGNEKICNEKKKEVASPISQVYEAAQKRKLEVQFEIIDETGPSHKKTFVTECQLGDFKTTGEGSSKKESKRAAAEKMLAMFPYLPEVNDHGTYQDLGKRNKKKNKKNKVIKSNFQKINMMFDNIMEYGAEMFNEIGKHNDKSQQNPKPPSQGNRKSAADEILEIGNLMNFEIQFSDYTEGEQSYSLLSMDLKPSFICFGLGVSEKDSREKAAKGAINFLYKLGYLDNISEKMNSATVNNEERQFVWVKAMSEKQDKDEL